ncbi:MAG: hypothetical protein RLP44_21025 [Aggregatilineales bacterium]
MLKRCLLTLTLLIISALSAACTSGDDVPREPTVVPFPTVTAGVSISGNVSAFNPNIGVNPATAIAIANQPTPTPDLLVCPPLSGEVALRDVDDDNASIVDEITRFLSAGGSPVALEDALRDQWEILGEDGFIRADIDLTGEGQPEIIVAYTAPDEGGVLLILGCVNRRYEARFTANSDTFDPPTVIFLSDMNNDGRSDVLFTTRRCDSAVSEVCEFQTNLTAWQPTAFRFVSLLGTVIVSGNPPEVVDFDNDSVQEFFVRIDNRGDEITGPLRTGTNIYDWNGSGYVLSIVQVDPPLYRIQVVQEADNSMVEGFTPTAINLYQSALTDDSLRNWYDDETPILDTYIYYRVLIAQAAPDIENGNFIGVYQSITETFNDPELVTPYLVMAQIFFDSYQVAQDASAACAEVVNYVLNNPEALELLNRYGTNNPTYTARQLCPL